MKHIFFIRHAESVANKGGLTKDPSSILLSETGHEQARALAETIDIIPERIIASQYLRTQETAQPLAEKFRDVPFEIWDTLHEFTYLDRKKYNNTTPMEREGPTKRYWEMGDPLYRDGLEEESFLEFLKRVERAREALKLLPEKNICVFSHGQTIRCFGLLEELGKPVNTLTHNELVQAMQRFIYLRDNVDIHNAHIYTLNDLIDR